MTDSGGPGTVGVKPCSTAGLADLGDTEGFGEAGTENTLYAFQLSGGVYKRVEVPAPQQSAPLNFGDLNDVTVGSLVANRNYKLHYTGKQWKPAIDTINVLGGWHLEIKPALPYLYLGKTHSVKKIQNKGQLLAAYVPGRKKNIIVEDNPLHDYVLGTKGARSGTLNLTNEFSSRLVVPGGTIFIEAVLGDRPDDFIPLINGLKLKWVSKATNQLVHIYIRVPDRTEEPIVEFSLLGVTHQITKICRGSSTGLMLRGEDYGRYNYYKKRYTNCTYVHGNLEIVFLQNMSINFDLSFLSDIREVTGYVLIVAVYAQYIPLHNLRIIRGRTVFKSKKDGEQYSLYIALNAAQESRVHGLMELQFKSLSEILDGGVFFHNNNLLCYENTILWSDINPSISPPVQFSMDSEHYVRQCGECDPACFQVTTGRRHCWGKGPDMCQKLSRGDVCNPNCDGRCFGPLPSQCCHPECAGGCRGTKNTDCTACKNFNNDGECVPYCPPELIYDEQDYLWKKNPNAKYAYGPLCVKECPPHLVRDRDGCVKSCRPKTHAVNGSCEPCKGPCPKMCNGNDENNFLGAHTLINYKNCTVIKGNLRILVTTFEGDPRKNEKPMHIEDLEVLSDVKEVTGYVMIQSAHPEFHNLSFLRNLEIIRGRNLDTAGNSLTIMSTPLKVLDLVSLKNILSGKVFIYNNQDLCFAETINFNNLFSSSRQTATVHKNKNPEDCQQDNLICDDQCSNGCWGAGPEKCLACKGFHVANTKLCLSSCDDIPRLFHDGGRICKKCHSECLSTCTGPAPEECMQCLNVRDGPYCRDQCPPSKYSDEFNVCQPCHPNCFTGCSGNSSLVYNGGCDMCHIGIMRKVKEDNIPECLPKDSECEDGYFKSIVPLSDKTNMAGKYLCEQCHEECVTCQGRGAGFCTECKHFKFDQRCVKSCLSLTFPKENKECSQCHDECLNGCHGPDTTDCDTCKKFKVYLNESSEEFNCTQTCPDDKPFTVTSETEQGRIHEVICADGSHPTVRAQEDAKNEKKQDVLTTILAAVFGSLGFIALVLLLVCYVSRLRARSTEKTAQLTARMAGFVEAEPITPTEARPDLAQLRLIKESELRKGSIIGSGAFGTVYKGLWTPDGENVKIPVAIKVLQEGTSPNQNKELLEEARVMASVDNRYCIRILAVCMTAQMMLITQLMPLGNLLDYVRKNKDHISSKVLLNWCTQIAKGMMYLEERGIVHRDLAARNVLVQAPGHVRITDFGLAKLLDFEEDEYHAAGGKMPIKWLALECIQHRVFTHKSDVWSYGVTVWELFTYGQRPYDTIRARVVPDLLEKGERLPQPSICTIDVYMIMIKCWMLDAESRPSFKELSDEFSKMARDPGRYLVIQGEALQKMPEVNNAIELVTFDHSYFPTVSNIDEGDKLMRLPSHTYDKNDLIRNLSVAGDDVTDTRTIMEAEEYMKPESRDSASASKFQPLCNGEEDDSVWDDEPAATNVAIVKEDPHQHPRREKRYGHLESESRRRQSPNRGRGDSANSRYSSDPMRMLHYNRDTVDGSSPPTSPNGLHSPPVPPLLVDEDDYLQPKSSNPAAYMDLIDSKEYYNQLEKGMLPKVGIQNKYTPSIAPVTVDNPEYFEDDAFETDHPLNTKARISPPSVHDYYDYSRIPREKQPLMYNHSSESTV